MYSFHISRNYGTCPQVFGHEKVYPQSTLFRGHDPGILFGEITRKPVHRHKGSGKSPSHLVHVALMRRG
jgi:hypothetical protein